MRCALPLFALLLVVAGIPAANVAYSQAVSQPSHAAAPPTFDVASIRQIDYADGAYTHIYNPYTSSDLRAVNVSLRDLLEVAYDIPETRMFGGPDWAATRKFDLEAKSDEAFNRQLALLSPDQGKQIKQQMLLALLVDRFKLAVHAETREMPAYALVLAKSGSKLARSIETQTGLSGGRGSISILGGNDSLAVLAFELSWRLGSPVLNQTGIEGSYRIKLDWVPDDTTQPTDGGPSLFTAIQEQLGLKLAPTRGPVPVLVIDHAESPSSN